MICFTVIRLDGLIISPALHAGDPPAIVTEPARTYPVTGAKHIRRKLSEIVLPVVQFDNLPLGEVIAHIAAEAKKHDPEGRGLNFVIHQPFDVVPIPAADTNGAGVVAIAKPADALVRISGRLSGLTLRDALSVLCSSCDFSVKFYIEEYAVAIIPRRPGEVLGRTFRANPDTFKEGLPGVVSGATLPVVGAGRGN
jgi:hypothetical protein